MPLTAERAQQMIAASQARAREIGVAVSTAIVDDNGRLFAFARMENAPWVSVEVSRAKAYTGALLGRDGSELAQVPANLFTALGSLHGQALIPTGSVTVLREGDRVIAGIGCSGATDEEDGECARAARDAFTA
jgi:uncharacterized protein GlcG (DUF336 family)